MEVIFYRGPETLFGNLVRLWTWSKYSHCELEFSPAPGEGRGKRLSALSEGVCWRPPLVGAQISRWDGVPLRVSEEDELHILNWANQQIGDPYDWAGILFSQLLPFNRQSASKWFCSELCCAALHQIGLLSDVSAAISPLDLYEALTTSR